MILWKNILIGFGKRLTESYRRFTFLKNRCSFKFKVEKDKFSTDMSKRGDEL